MADSRTKALSMLSISAKAGKISSGGFMTERALQDGTASLVIIAEDASMNTRKKFSNKSEYYHVPYYIFSTSDELGKFIGKESRTTVAVLDEGLARSIVNNLEQEV
jgi:ribosomal protein L7Ae-like RNA K-turn-binding protein